MYKSISVMFLNGKDLECPLTRNDGKNELDVHCEGAFVTVTDQWGSKFIYSHSIIDQIIAYKE